MAPTVATAVTYWMMGWPEFMTSLLVLAGLITVAALTMWTKRRLLARFLLSIVAPIAFLTGFFWMMGQPRYWLSAIVDYERADRAAPPESDVVVFTGSSSVRKWETLAADMKPINVVNRAFGGSQIDLVTYYARRIVIPYHPRAIVLYAGDNDLSFPPWKSPELVLEEFKQFVTLIHDELPEAWLYYISMKPAPWGDWRLMNRTNRLIAAYSQTQERVQYIDVSGAMLDAKGELRREFYDWDPMHMNASGYALWTSIIKPILIARLGSQQNSEQRQER